MPPLPKSIDYDLVERTGKLMPSLEGLAIILDLKLSTVRRLLQTDEKFLSAWQRGNELGKMDIKIEQLKVIKEGRWVRDPTKRVYPDRPPEGQEGYTFVHSSQATDMLIHLGKTLLGQTEKIAIDSRVKVEQGGSRASEALMANGSFDPTKLTTDERVELSELCELVDQFGMPGLPLERQDRVLLLIRKGFVDQSKRDDKDEAKALPPPIDVEFKEAA